MNVLDHECQDCTSMYYVEPAVRPRPVNSYWSRKDYLGALKVRSGVKRYNYAVEPGLYALGQPGSDSEVLVTANYKLTFDILRRDLKGLDAWLLVLDTKGINVWCAAGKGTFGTRELINQIETTGIKSRIDHKRLILPQLGAPGVAAHEIKRATGLLVNYGPVRSKDLKAFLAHNRKADAVMRRVEFPLFERLKLTPTEVVLTAKYLLMALVFILLIAGLDGFSFDKQKFMSHALPYSFNMLLVFLSGTVIGPALLPLLPFRSFSLKGAFAGLIVWLLISPSGAVASGEAPPMTQLAFLLSAITAGSFFTMNFTGASTYTNLSGVLKEMKYAVPAQIVTGIAAILAFITSIFT